MRGSLPRILILELSHEMIIPLDISIADMMRKFPQTVQVFLRYRMICAGCQLSEFETLDEAIQNYGLDSEKFLEALKASIRAGEYSAKRISMKKEDVLNVLRTVIDPEIGINIVDLGLIYGIEIRPEEIHIQLTMTTPTCPLHGVITRHMERAVEQSFPALRAVNIELVWDPPWSPDRMSAAAKKQLGWQ